MTTTRVLGVGALALAGVLPLSSAPGTGGISAATPTTAPRLSSMWPQGAQRGTEVTVTIEGTNLLDTSAVRFASAGLDARILSTTAQSIRARITVALEAHLGQHDFRVSTPTGSTVAVFQVGSLLEIFETEPNTEFEAAQLVELPAIVNGTLGIDESGAKPGTETDYDFFRFRAEAGQTLTFDAISTRIGGTADTYLTLFDAKGNELAGNEDYYQDKDPFLGYSFDREGDYLLRVGTFAGGSRTSVYRLVIGELPYILHAFPNGGQRGRTVEFTLKGFNLAKVTKVVLGKGIATGEVVESSRDQAKFRMKIPLDTERRDYWLAAIQDDGVATTWPVLFNVDELPEINAGGEAARYFDNPVPVPTLIVVNGRIERHDVADHFLIEAEAGQRFSFNVHGMLAGSLIDPVVALYDSTGGKVAFQDDPASTDMWKQRIDLDPHLTHRFQQAGQYTVMVRDLTFRGHPDWVYRLKIRPVEPDFEIQILTPHQTILRGRTTKDNGPDRFDPVHLYVQVRRRGGWDTPVEVWAENLPPGVTGEKVSVPPENTYYRGTDAEDKWLDGTRVEVPLIAAPDAPLASQPIRIRARGVMEGRTVEREGRVLYEYNPTGFMARRRVNSLPDDDRMILTITDAPTLTLDAPGEFTIVKGEPKKLEVSLRWWGEPAGPVKLRIESLPDGVSIPEMEVTPEQEEAVLTALANLKAVEGVTRALLISEAFSAGEAVPLHSRDILIRVGGKPDSKAGY